jgi:hypothetical protein
MKILSPSEAACVYCRLGWLNIYNPCKPEGAWELDMSRREERVVAKTLCVLATNEPGDNWVFETFRWMRSMESMPGWELVSAIFRAVQPQSPRAYLDRYLQNFVVPTTPRVARGWFAA